MVWCGGVWSGVVWSGLVWSGVVWSGLVWSGLVWSGLVWTGVDWCGLVLCGLVWSGVVWCGLIERVVRVHRQVVTSRQLALLQVEPQLSCSVGPIRESIRHRAQNLLLRQGATTHACAACMLPPT